MENTEILKKCFDALSNFYLSISLEQAFDVLRFYDEIKITEEDFFKFAETYGNDDNASFYLFGVEELFTEEPVSKPMEKLIVNASLYEMKKNKFSLFYEFDKNVRSKDFYYLPFDEFIKYADETYMPVTEYSSAIENFFINEVGVSKAKAVVATYCFYDLIRFETGIITKSLPTFFKETKIDFTKEQFEKFLPLLSDFNNNTRLPLCRGFTPNEMRENADYSIHLPENPDAAKKLNLKIPSLFTFKEKRQSFDEYWKETPWHENGEKFIKKLNPEIRKYMQIFSKFPEDVMVDFFDMHLASLYHRSANRGTEWENQKWDYYAFEVLEKLGEDLYLCLRNDGKKIMLYSHSVTQELEKGKKVGFTILIDCGGWYLTYGSILLYKGYCLSDFDFLANIIAPQMYKASGFSAVVNFNPVPFWASASYAESPLLGHKGKLVLDCWQKGKLNIDEMNLSKKWIHEQTGKNHRWVFGSDYFSNQYIYWNEKKDVAYILAFTEDSFESLSKKVKGFFVPDSDVEKCSFTMASFIFGDLKKDLVVFDLEEPFNKV